MKTIDELIAFIQKDVDYLRKCGATGDVQASAIEVIIGKIKANQPALEAGMQKPLRCQIREYKWKDTSDVPEFQTYYQAYPIDLDGKYAVLGLYRSNSHDEARDRLIAKVESCGITAEFVKEESDDTETP